MSSWTRIKELGSGTVDFRLQIEGWPHEWVTHPRITHATNADGRTVYAGLLYEGLKISEKCDLRSAWPEVQSITATIVPTDVAESTMSFTRDPFQVGFLIASLDDGDTTWSAKPDPLPAGVYHLGTEAVECDGANNIERAVWNTGAQDHVITDATVENPVPIYSWPASMEGRRANLYAYGAGDAGSGDGHVIWRGVVARPPRMGREGVSWTIALDPITKLFDQNVGSASDIADYRVRGIYHSSSAPLFMAVRVFDQEEIGPRVTGFFEFESDWIAAVQTELDAFIAAGTGFIGPGSGTLVGLTYSIDSGHPAYLAYLADTVRLDIYQKDVVDGDMNIGSPAYMNGHAGHNGDIPEGDTAAVYIKCGDGEGEFFIWAASSKKLQRYGYPLPRARTFIGAPDFDDPAGSYDRGISALSRRYLDDDDGTWPNNRIYLNTVEGLSAGNTLCVVQEDDEHAVFMQVLSVDASESWIEVELKNARNLYLSNETPIVPVGTFGTSTDWSGFMFEIVTQAPAANLGRVPYITAEDVESAAWSALWATDAFNDYWRLRNYYFIKPIKVRDVLAPEFMATGYMGRLNAEGRLDVTKMPVLAPQQSALFTVDDNELLLPADGMFGRFPTWEVQRDGFVNIVKLRLGYNPVTDDFDEVNDYTVRQVNSIAEHKSGNRALQEIEIRSIPATTYITPGGSVGILFVTPPTTDELVSYVGPYLRTMSEDYAIVTVAVPFTMFEVLCGDIVEVTSAFIPDGLGARGVTQKKMICIGREWTLDPAANQMGVLTLWCPRDSSKRAGYAPTGRITGQSNTSGDTWVLTFSTGNAFNIAWSEDDDGDIVKHFEIGDPIQIVRVDANSPAVRTGFVTAKPAANQITVALTSSWTPSTNTWNLRFWYPGSESSTPGIEYPHEFYYCWVADADQRLSDGTSVARSFV